MKRPLWTAVLAAVVTVTVACNPAAVSPSPVRSTAPSSPGASTAASATPDARAVEITFMNWFYDGPMKSAYDSFIEDFLAAEARVTAVNVETQPFIRYHDVLNVKLTGGNAPNVSWINASLSSSYVGSGRLVDLMPYIEATEGFDLDDFTESSLAPWRSGDQLLGLPFTNATNVVFYNKDIFTAAGLKTPDEMVADGTWTWDNLKATAKALVDAQRARYGFIFGNNIYTNGWRNLVEIFGSYGGAPWSDDGTTCEFTTPETTAAVQAVWDMVYVDKSHPEPGVDANFAAGDIGMNLTRPSFAFQWQDAGFEWSVVRQPDGPAGYVPSLAQNGIVAYSEAANADLAAAFLISTLTREHAIEFQGNTPSNRKSTHNAETLQQALPLFTPEQIESTVMASLTAEKSVLEYSHPNFGPVNSNAQQQFDGQVWKPDADVPAAMSAVCGAIDALLG